jgi:anti-sigma factor (TIGR02949 family)
MTHTHKTKCDQVLDSLCEYLDGELHDELCRELERHLTECEDCRVIVDTTKKTIYLVQCSTEADSPCPDDVRERLFQRLDLDEFLKKTKK